MDQKSDNNKDFFDPKKYNTVIIKKDEKSGSGNKETALIEALANTENKDVREEALKQIKKVPGALDLLIAAINDKNTAESKAELIAACWESGIDCRPQLSYFVNLAIREDYLCCIEAMSVILGMDTPVDQTVLNKSLEELNAEISHSKGDKKELLKQVSDSLLSLKD